MTLIKSLSYYSTRRKRENVLPLHQNALLPRLGTGSLSSVPLLMTLVCCFSVFSRTFWEYFEVRPYGIIAFFLICACSLAGYVAFSTFRLRELPFQYLLFIALTASYCVFSAFINNGAFRYFGVVFVTMGSTMLVACCKIRRLTLKFSLLCLTLSTTYALSHVSNYFEKQWNDDLVNSNYIAYYGLVLLIYGNVFLTLLYERDNAAVRLFRIGLGLSSFLIIWNSSSRGVLLGWICYYICLLLVPWNFWRVRRNVLFVALLLMIGSILMTYVYCKSALLTQQVVMGKSTGHRLALWTYFWNEISTHKWNLWFGFGTRAKLTKIFGYGLHNVYLNMWYFIGLIGYLLFMLFILWNLSKAFRGKRGLEPEQGYALIGFLSLMVADNFSVNFTLPLVVWNYALLGLVHLRRSDIR